MAADTASAEPPPQRPHPPGNPAVPTRGACRRHGAAHASGLAVGQAGPFGLDRARLHTGSGADGHRSPRGDPAAAALASPQRRYDRYHKAMRDLDRPRLFDNRVCYRLLGAERVPSHEAATLTFGHMRYFDM